MNNQVAEDSTSETCTVDTRYMYAINGKRHPSSLDLALCSSPYNEFDTIETIW